jgi:acetyl-CoA synthetase
MSATESLTYEAACEAHRWRVPERYNIAAEVCDRQPRNRTAMIFEDFRGSGR